MKNRIATTSLAAMALLAFCAVSNSVSAAELVKLEGKVSVNRGDGFGPATLGMVLKAGDQVLVGEKSTASLVYAQPGCVVDVAPASVVTVTEVGACIPGQTLVQGKSALVTPTQASTQTSGNFCDDDDSDNDDDNECLPFFVMGGGAIVGAAALIIYGGNSGGGGAGVGDGDGDGQGGVGGVSPE